MTTVGQTHENRALLSTATYSENTLSSVTRPTGHVLERRQLVWGRDALGGKVMRTPAGTAERIAVSLSPELPEDDGESGEGVLKKGELLYHIMWSSLSSLRILVPTSLSSAR